MHDATQAELLARAQQGDEAAIGELYEQYSVRIFRYLYYRLGNQQAAEDLTSEVFIRLMRSLPSYRPPNGSIQAWLFQVARNLAIDHHRYMAYRDHAALHDNLVQSGDDPVSMVDRSLNNEQLRLALAQLPVDQREVVILRFVVAMPIAEVAELVQKSEDAVKGLQRRGLMALRVILDGWEGSYV
jgi:RNA polymerase sigma-70 factor (ECF subfamily)